MSVKTQDRHTAQNDTLLHARKLLDQILIITHPREFNNMGHQIRKPGILGEGQSLLAFGNDLIKCAKLAHGNCYEAQQIHLKSKETLESRNQFHMKALSYCDSILRQLDYCIYAYGRKNKKKINSFKYIAKLTRNLKNSIKDRENRDFCLYQRYYNKK